MIEKISSPFLWAKSQTASGLVEFPLTSWSLLQSHSFNVSIIYPSCWEFSLILSTVYDMDQVIISYGPYDLAYNRGQLKNPGTFGPSAHWEFSICILKLNVKMAPEMWGFLSWLPLRYDPYAKQVLKHAFIHDSNNNFSSWFALHCWSDSFCFLWEVSQCQILETKIKLTIAIKC